ncbi:hypothetical protein Taro_009669 [Colocasia esculenta]|uniref:Uncharacterized protein n=1 Tax=Colocasia esculenta TaxID=4460 RepID=A0A843U4Q2_COLES|nr:hypothetical protein [Colocasia esculenta]
MACGGVTVPVGASGVSVARLCVGVCPRAGFALRTFRVFRGTVPGGSGGGSPRTGLCCFCSFACCSVLSDGLCCLVVGLCILVKVLPRIALCRFWWRFFPRVLRVCFGPPLCCPCDSKCVVWLGRILVRFSQDSSWRFLVEVLPKAASCCFCCCCSLSVEMSCLCLGIAGQGVVRLAVLLAVVLASLSHRSFPSFLGRAGGLCVSSLLGWSALFLHLTCSRRWWSAWFCCSAPPVRPVLGT